jgi:SAM-dependent methyltransferase
MKAKRSLTERLIQRVFYKFYARNLLYELQMRARAEAADYVQAHMAEAQIFTAHRDIVRHAAGNAAAGGLFLEFGVATGNTIREIAAAAPAGTTVYGFDTFSGLPGDWSGHVETAGAFRQKGLPKVPGNVRLVRGLFADTLPGFMADNAGPVSFAHIDCDLYVSTVDILTHIGPRLGEGALLLFDEYFNYPGWKLHEHRAWREYTEAEGIRYSYLGFTALDGRVLVRIDGRDG